MDCSIEEFYQDVRDAQRDNNETDPYILVFIDCLLASADYDSFYKVMYKQGLLSKAKKNAGGFQPMHGNYVADAKADSKLSSSPVRDAKERGLEDSSSGGSFKADGKEYK